MAYEYSLADLGAQVSHLEDFGKVTTFELHMLVMALALIERLEEIDKSLYAISSAIDDK